MHTIQYVVTQADSKEEAFSGVKQYLEAQLGGEYDSHNTWFDWFVTGGGRWSTSVDSYDDNYQDDVAYQSEPRFQEYLDKAKEFRQTTFEEYLKQANEIDYTNLLSEIAAKPEESYHGGMQLYPIKKVYDMTMGMWDYNSYFFDIISDSANMTHVKNSIDNGADNWYAVPVDFHF